MAAEFNIESRWPELLLQLDERQRRVVVDTLASSWHEGWVPNREDVENLPISRGEPSTATSTAVACVVRLSVDTTRSLAPDPGSWPRSIAFHPETYDRTTRDVTSSSA